MMFLQSFACLPLILQISASEVEVKPGEDAVLECRAPSGASATVLEWTKADLPADECFFFYRNGRSYEKYQHPSFRGRVVLQNPSGVQNGDVSVVLKNVSLEDMGTYRCRVLMSSTWSGAKEHSEVIQLRNMMHSGTFRKKQKVQTLEDSVLTRQEADVNCCV
ncbi:myelin-oligodendrocyte glycoprotein-like [Girardinichthys multiradiatus]|uniref:myelin-oligodendrocyte glycoprotein-like n=1 Tax=Girardinichthys multiradiatus TaxID=208333 RepID=UPI001FAD919E|nr:myelin-oligodendrocyte glycoprotein-like [Girardinichthys multiradiatus]